MNQTLDSYIGCIAQETKKQVKKSPDTDLPPKQLPSKGYILFTDSDLEQMIPTPSADILINAHLPEFDRNIVSHQHTFYELVYVHSGHFHMTINRRSFLFSAGDFVLLNPSVIHSVSLGEADTKVLNILMKRSLFNKSFFHIILNNQVFADFLLPSLSKQKEKKNYMIYPGAAKKNPMLTVYLIGLLREYLEHRNMSDSAMEINLSGLCLELARSYQQTEEDLQKKEQQTFSLADICQYILERLKTVTLEETAAHFHYNPKYFSQILKKIYGKSFSGLLTDLRLTHAAKLLTQTNLPVSTVIHETGYENTSYFYRVFQDCYGMKPGEYREQNQRPAFS